MTDYPSLALPRFFGVRQSLPDHKLAGKGRLYDKLELPKMYMNGLTGNALAAIKIPIVLDTDRQALAVALHSAGRVPADARIAIVRSTADLHELWVSEALRDEVAANSALEIVSAAAPLEFADDDRLGVTTSPRGGKTHVSSRS